MAFFLAVRYINIEMQQKPRISYHIPLRMILVICGDSPIGSYRPLNGLGEAMDHDCVNSVVIKL